jgi:hypothetical protein
MLLINGFDLRLREVSAEPHVSLRDVCYRVDMYRLCRNLVWKPPFSYGAHVMGCTRVCIIEDFWFCTA